jgi:hypothetical protein
MRQSHKREEVMVSWGRSGLRSFRRLTLAAFLISAASWTACRADTNADLRSWAAQSSWYGDSVSIAADGTVEIIRDISDLHSAQALKTPGLFRKVMEYHAYSWLSSSSISGMLTKFSTAQRVRLTLFYTAHGVQVVAGKFRINRATFSSDKYKSALNAESSDAKTFLTLCRKIFDGVWINSSSQ